MKAKVLLSGGLDSTVAAAMAVDAYGAENVSVISFVYGQKHDVEVQQARAVACELFGPDAAWNGKHQVIVIDGLLHGAEKMSTLLNGGADVPELTYEELEASEGPSPTYVPLRNPLMLTIAAVRAMIEGEGEVWCGVHAEDAARDAYPDCRADCIGSLGSALYIGSYHEMKLVAPLAYFTKADVVRKGLELAAPLHLTHSCYNGARPACGKCPTCLGRLAAFAANGVADPIPYTESAA